MNPSINLVFRSNLREGRPLLGTFVKTLRANAIEILADAGFHFVVIDAEHAPFDRMSIDQAILEAQAAGIAALVRTPDHTSAHMQSAIDCGSAGVVVPRVTTALAAEKIVAACRFRGGQRGYSNSPRAGRYGRLSMKEHIADGDDSTSVVAMIEDALGISNVTTIVNTPGVDAIFVGRGDLAVSLSAEGPSDRLVDEAVNEVCRAARVARKPVMTMISTMDERKTLAVAGISSFVVSSDQGLMRRAALAVVDAFATGEQ